MEGLTMAAFEFANKDVVVQRKADGGASIVLLANGGPSILGSVLLTADEYDKVAKLKIQPAPPAPPRDTE